MKRILTLCAAGILIAPSLFLAWFVLNHLFMLYCSDKLYSFGINLQFGVGEIRDPWSDVLILLCNATSIGCGIGLLRNPKNRKLLFAIGALALTLVTVAVSMLMV